MDFGGNCGSSMSPGGSRYRTVSYIYHRTLLTTSEKLCIGARCFCEESFLMEGESWVF